MNHRILVVDDNRDNAESLARLLQLMGHETAIAYDGLSAVDSVDAFRPEIVLLDVGLPGLDGYEVARRIRAQSWGKDMTLIAVTGWGQAEDRRRSREAGFDHHMVKPVDFGELGKVLE
jgi:DNA-binding response OmpR family regulator